MVKFCDDCKNFKGWISASLALCNVDNEESEISGYEIVTCEDYKERNFFDEWDEVIKEVGFRRN